MSDATNVCRSKAHAAVQRCHEVNPRIEITGHARRSETDLAHTNVVFAYSDAARADFRDENAESWGRQVLPRACGGATRPVRLVLDIQIGKGARELAARVVGSFSLRGE
jgi:hypothetical protein